MTTRRKNVHAVALGRLGGKAGGKARAAALSDQERIAIAKQGAAARWAGHEKKGPKKKSA